MKTRYRLAIVIKIVAGVGLFKAESVRNLQKQSTDRAKGPQ